MTAAYKIIDLEQGSPEWLAWKQFKIGASEIASLMDESPFYPHTQLQLWEKKIEGKTTKDNPAMKRGREFEPVALEWVNRSLNTNYKPKCIESIDKPYLIASLDGMDEKGPALTLEIKNMKKELHDQVKNGKIPEYYQWQLQEHMLVDGLPDALFCSFYHDHGHFLDVKKDQSMCDRIEERAAKFHSFLMNFEMPPPCDKDYQKLEDPDLIDMLTNYDMYEKTLKQLENHIKPLREAVIARITNYGLKRAIVGSKQITNYLSRGRIDYDKVPELKGVNLDMYRKSPTSSWRFTSV